ncbi:MAG: DUF4097 family beta strand repeat-containing protein [Candidatus Hydrothermales bacterium]
MERLKDKRIDLILNFPINVKFEKIEISVINGGISISSLSSKSYKVKGTDGAIFLNEIKGHGEFELLDGYIELKFSHKDTVDLELEVTSGAVCLDVPEDVSIFPEVTGGIILPTYIKKERKSPHQKVRCEILAGALIIKSSPEFLILFVKEYFS